MTNQLSAPAAATLALLGLAGCQASEPPNSVQRASAGLEGTAAKVGTGVADFGKKVSEKLDAAGRAIGNTATRIGQNVHDRVSPDLAAPGAAPAPDIPPPDSP